MANNQAVALTTDIWTSVSNDAYISVTSSMITSGWEIETFTLTNANIEV